MRFVYKKSMDILKFPSHLRKVGLSAQFTAYSLLTVFRNMKLWNSRISDRV